MSKRRKSNGYYTQEFKDKVIDRLESSSDDTVASLSEEFGISKTAIYHWSKQRRGITNTLSKTKWNSKDKFHIVVETAALTEQELASYCRKKGLFVKDVKAWRDQCIRANTSNPTDPRKLKDDLREGKRRIKGLESELRRKEKALAETAALLVLRKKAQAIWGDPEEE